MNTWAWLRAAGLSLVLTSVTLTAGANPQGGQVVAGKGSISTPNGNTTVINQQSNNLVINWSSFNIANGQTVLFKQPSTTAAALNRIYDQNASQIFGNLISNGQVFLLNANGIVFGRTASVNTGALFATSLNISNNDFMNGDLDFAAAAGQDGGAIVNHGLLHAVDGGSISLVGGAVYNDGVIQANLGQVNMVAGHAVTVDFDGDGLMQFEVTQPVLHKMLDASSGAAVTNEGTVEADGGSVLMTADVARQVFVAAVNNSGVVEATGVSEQDGSVFLDGVSDPSEAMQRPGKPAARVAADGAADASSGNGGSITLSATGGEVVNSGTLDVHSTTGNGGTILLQSDATTILRGDGVIDASSSAGVGGSVQVLGFNAGLLDDASIDASGSTGGGTVLVGGDEHGGNGVQTASAAYLSPTASISADALGDGDGGKVILWSNDYTGFYGSISARGGKQGGDGGFVETSSHDDLQAYGSVIASAPLGQGGEWLLDPSDVTISSAGSSGESAGPVFTPTASPATINATTIEGDLTAGTSVTVNTTCGACAGTGSITVDTSATILNSMPMGANSATLTLNVNSGTGGIAINTGIGVNAATTGKLTLSLTSPAGVTLDAPISTNGGSFTSNSVTFTSNGSGTITTTPNAAATGVNGGNIGITATTGGINLGANLTTTGGNATTAANNSGAGGTIGLTDTGGGANAVTMGSGITLTSTGGTNTAAAGGNGAAGGAVTISATSGSITLGAVNAAGSSGDGTGSRTGAVGGTVSITTTTSGAIDIQSVVTNSVGNNTAANAANGNSNTTAPHALTISSVGALTIAGAVSNNGGNGGGTGARTGGAGGTVNIGWGGAATFSAAISADGGNGSATGTGGAGGTINLIGTGSAITTNSLNAVAGTGTTAGAGGNVTIETGGQPLVIDGNIDALNSSGTSGGTVTLGIAAQKVGMVTEPAIINAGTLLVQSTGSVTLNNDSNEFLTALSTTLAPGGFTLDNGGATLNVTSTIGTTNAPITLIADEMVFTGGANTISSGTGLVTLTPDSTGATEEILIGGADASHVLGITQTDLSAISTSGGLTIGSTAFGGFITNTTGAGGSAVTLVGTSITGGLTLISDEKNGTTFGITLGNTITTNNQSIVLLADSMSFTTAGDITAGTGLVTLDDVDAATQIQLGGTGAVSATVLNLSSTDLNEISTSGDLTIGDTTANTGGIVIEGSFGATGVTAGTMQLLTKGTVTVVGGTIAPDANVNLTVNAGGAATLPAVTLTGTGALSVTSGGAIGQAGALSIAGTSSFNTLSGNGNITLTTGTNAFTGAVTFTTGTGNASIDNSIALVLGASSVGGNLAVVETGTTPATTAISQTGALTVGGTSSFNSSAGNGNITLTTAGNAFTGAVSFSTGTGNASIDNSIALVLGASSVGGNLAVVETGTTPATTAISQTGALTVGGTSSFNSSAGNGNITLTTGTNAFTGAVTFTTGTGNASIDNSIALALGASSVGGNLAVVETGTTPATTAISQTGALTVGGTSSFNSSAGNGNITLTTGTNAFTGAVTFTTGTGNASIDNSIALVLGASSVGGNLAVVETGTTPATTAISQTGALTVGGTSSFNSSAGNGNITLTTGTNAFTGAVSFSTGTGNASLTNNIATVLGASTVGGTLGVATNGALTETGALTVTGAATFTQNSTVAGTTQDINLGTQNNDFKSSVNFVAGAGAAINNLSLLNIDATPGSLAFPGTIGGNLTIDYTNAGISLGAVSVGGNLSVTANGGISETGALTVTGTSSFTTTGTSQAISLNTSTNALGGAVSFTTSGAGGNVSLLNSGGTQLAASTIGGNLSVSDTTGAISQTGALTVGGTAGFTTAGANNITLTTAGNAFTGAVSFSTGTGNASIDNSIALVLGASSVGGNLAVVETGTTPATTAISQTGALTVGGTSSFNSSAGNGNITLTTGTNAFTGAVTFTTGTGNASIDNSIALALGASSVGGNLAVVETGTTPATTAISQTGALTVGGTSSFNSSAGNGNITLTTGTNAFTGAVTFTTGTGNASIDNSIALVLGASSVGGNLAVVETGTTPATTAISQTGALTVGGTSSFNSSAGNGNITLTTGTNAFTGAVSFSTGTGNASLTNNIATVLGASTVGGTLGVATNGALTETGALTVTGAATFTQNSTVAGTTQDINLGTQNNDFKSSVNFVAGAGAAINNLSLLNIDATPGSLAFPGTIGGNLTIDYTNAGISLGAVSVGGNLSVTANGGISETGALTVTGTSSFTTTGTSQAISLNTSTNALGGAVSFTTSGAGGNVSLLNSGGTQLAASTIGGNLSVSDTTGAISQTGALTVGGTAGFTTAGANNITLTTAGNAFTGAVSFSTGTGNASIDNSIALALGASSVGGNLAVVETGTTPATTAISQTGALTVGGTSSFNSSAGNGNITLTTGTNAFTGAVTFTTGTGNASIDNSIALALGASSVGGNLAVVETGTTPATTAISQTGALTVGGTSSFNSSAGNGNITLTTAGNAFTGAVSFSTGTGNASLTNNIATVLGASTVGGTLNVATNGALSETGALTVGGAATFTQNSTVAGTTQDINLGTQNNDFQGAVNFLTGAGAVIHTLSLLNIDATPGTLTFPASVTGNLTIDYVNTSVSLGAVTVGGNMALTADGTISQTGAFTVAGTSTFNSTSSGGNGDVTLTTAGNAFTGAVTFTTGTGNASLTNNRATVLGASVIGGSLTVSSNGAISETGILNVAGGSSFSTTGSNQAITLNSSTNVLGGVVSFSTSGATGNVSLLNSGGTDLGASTIGGSLSVTDSTGSISEAGVLSVGGNASFTTSTANQTINLGTQTNVLGGTIAFTTSGAGGNVSLLNSGGTQLAASTIGGNLSVSDTTGAISQTGALTVGGTAGFTTAGANNITLTTAGNAFTGAVSFSTGTGNASIDNSIALALGASSVGGNLAVVETGTTPATTAISQTGALTVGGTSSFNSSAGNGNITLTTGTNAFTGAVTFTTGTGNASIDNSIALALGASSVGGNLAVVETGTTPATTAISQTGALTVGGTSSFNSSAGNGNITLTTAGNAFTGAVSFSTGTGNASLTNNIATVLGASTVGGTLNVATNGALSETGALTVGGAATFTQNSTVAGTTQDINLGTQNNDFQGAVNFLTGAGAVIHTLSLLNIDATPGTLTFPASVTGNLTIDYVNTSVSLGAVTVGGNMALTADGTISQTGAFTVAGTSTFNSTSSGGNGDVTLTTAGNAFTGAVTFTTGTGNASLTNNRATVLGASVIGGSLTVSSNGAISETGILNVAGGSSFSTTGSNQAITLNSSTNVLGGVVSFSTSGATGNVSLLNSGGTDLGASTIGGSLSVTDSTGSISEAGVLSVGGNASFTTSTANQTINLGTQTNVLGGTIAFTTSGAGGNVSLLNSGGTQLAASTIGGNLSVSDTTGAISQTGALTVGGTAGFTTAGANNITLTTAGNAFTGAVSFSTGTGNASLTNNRATVLGTSTVGGTLNVATNGALSETGALTVGGAATFTQNSTVAGATQDINLGTQNNDFQGAVHFAVGAGAVIHTLSLLNVDATPGVLTFPASVTGNLTIDYTNAAVSLGAATVGGNMAITADGDISQTGALTVGGTAGFTTAGANNITLTTAGNAFTGAVSFSTGTGNASIDNSIALALGASSVGGNLAVVETGTTPATTAISQTGALTVGGTSSFNSSAGNGNITLTTGTNAFTGAVSFSTGTGNASIDNSIALALGASSVGGNLAVVETGTTPATTAISQTGALTVGGTSSFNSSAGNGNITLTTAGNAFTGAVSFSTGTGNASLVNNRATILGASTIGGTFDVSTDGALSETGVLDVGGNAMFTQNSLVAGATQDINLGTQNNDFQGSVTFAAASAINNLSFTNVDAAPGSLVFPGTIDGNLTIDYTNAAVSLGAVTVGGNMAITANGDIDQSGAFTVTGTSNFNSVAGNGDVTLGSNNLFTGAVTFTTGTGSASLTNNRATVLGASVIGGSLTVSSNGAISQTGILNVAGGSSFSTTGASQAITLNSSTNVLGGIVSFSTTGATGNVSLLNSGGTDLGASTIGGSLTVTDTTGSISESGALAVGGASSFTTSTAGQAITLNTSTNALGGTIAFTTTGATGNVSLLNSGGTDLGASTIGGSLSVTDTTGSITQAGALTVTGTSSFDSSAGNGNVTLTTGTNAFTGAVSFTTGTGNASLTNSRATSLGASTIGGTFTVSSNGIISETGVLSVGGNASFTTTGAGQAINLASQTNVLGGTIAFTTTGATGSVSLLNSGGTDLGASSIGGSLTVTDTTGGISQAGALTVTGAASFTTTNQDVTLTTATNAFTGAVSFSTGTGNASLVNNRATILGASTIGGTFDVSTDGALSETGVLDVGGNAMFTQNSLVAGATQDINLGTQNNDFQGSVTFAAASAINNLSFTNVDAAPGSLVFPGTIDGNLTIDYTNAAVSLGAVTVGGNMAITANGDIDQSGAFTVTGTSNFNSVAGNGDVTLGSNNLFTGAVTFTTGTGSASLTNNRATVLGASVIGGSLTVSSNGAISQTGILNVAGGSSFSTTGASQAITLNSSTNVLGGIVSFSTTGATGNVSLLNSGGTDLGASTIGGSLTVTDTTGSISESGALAVGGASSFTTSTAGQAITLNTSTNALGGTIAFTTTGATGNVSLLNSGGTDLGASTIGGSLSVTDTTGSITQAGALTVTGTSSFDSSAGNGNVTLTTGTNAFTGAVSFTTGTGNASLTNSRATSLGASTIGGTFTVSSNGIISETGVLSVGGNASFTTTGAGQAINLASQTNVLGGTIAFTTTGATGSVSLLNSGGTDLGASSIGGSLTVTDTTGGISQAGALTVTGAASFTTTNQDVTLTTATNAFTGAVSFSTGTGNASLVNNRATILGASTIGGTFDVSTDGALSETGVLDVGGNAMFTQNSLVAGATQDINLGTQNNDFQGSVTFAAASAINNLSFTNVDAAPGSLVFPGTIDGNLTIDYTNAAVSLGAVTVGGNMAITANGDIDQSGAFTVTGTSNFNSVAGNGDVTLGSNNLFTGAVTFTTGTGSASLTNNRATVLGASVIGGSLTVSSNGAISQTGILNVAGGSSFSTTGASQAITLNSSTNVLGGIVSFSTTGATGNVSLLNSGGTDLGASTIGGSLTVTDTTGSISESGALAVGGASSFTTSTAGQAITLNTSTNALGGTIAFTTTGATGNVSLLNSGGTDLGASTIGGSLSVTDTTGSITQAGALTVTGTSSFDSSAGNGNVTLTTGTNAFTGAVSFTTGTGNASLTNSRATSLGASTIGGTFTVSSNGIISETGVLSVGGNASFTTTGAGQAINLASQTNVLGGTIAFTTTGATGSVSLLNSGGTDLGASSIGGSLTVTDTTGGISQAGALTVTGAASFTTTNQDVTLTTATNAFTGAVSFSTGTGNASLVNNRATILGASTIGGTFDVSTDGALSETGVLDVGGNAMFTQNSLVAGATQDINLGTQNNDFQGSVTFAAASAINNLSFTNVDAAPGSLVFPGTIDGNLTIDYTNAAVSLGAVTVGGNMAITANGDIDQSGAFTVTGTSNFNSVAGNGDVTLGSNNLFTGAVTFTTGTGSASLTNNRATVLGASVIGGSLTVSSNGAISQTGALTVGSTASFDSSAGNGNITLTIGTNAFTGAVTFTTGTGSASLNNSEATTLGTSTVGGALNVVTNGVLNETGVLTVGGNATFTQNSTTAGATQDIDLGTQNNDFQGNVSFVAGAGAAIHALSLINVDATPGSLAFPGTITGNLTIDYTNAAVSLGALAVGGNMVVTANGNISESGAFTVTGTSSFDSSAGNGNITLGSANLFTGAVSFTTGTGNASLTNNRATSLGASTIGGTFTVSSNGAISETGVLSVGGNASFSTSGQAINLASQTNVLGGTVSFTAAGGGGNVSLLNSGGTDLGTSSIGGSLSVTDTTGGISQAGALTVTGASSFDSSGGNQDVTLTTATNAFTGAVSFSTGTGNASLTNNQATVLGGSTVGGTLSVATKGALSETGVLDVGGNATFTQNSTVAGATQDINLGTQNNDFQGSVTFAAASAINNLSFTNVDVAPGSLTFPSTIDGNLTIDYTNAAVSLGAATVGGNMAITANGGIGQTGIFTVTGTSSFDAGGGDVTLSNTGNDFTGAVSVANAGNVTLDDKNGLTLAGIGATGAVVIDFGQAGTGATLNLGVGAITGSSVAISGGAGNDTIDGQAGTHVWTLTGADAGSIDSPTFTFVSVENLVGGSGADTFNLNGGYATTINGGGGADIIDVTSNVNAAGQSLIFTAETIESTGGAVLTASNLTLSGLSGATGTGSGLDTAVSSLTINASTGATAIIDNAGSLILDNIALGNTGTFNLTVNTGNITSANSTVVTADNASFTASNGSVGTSAANVLTNLAGTLTATATNGSVWVTDSGSLTLGNIAATSGANSIHLTAVSMTATSDTLSAGTGGTTLTTSGTMTLDDVTVANDLDLANTGTLTIGGSGNPGLHLTTANATLIQSGPGGVTLDSNIQTAGNVSIHSGVTVNGARSVTTGNGSAAFAGAISGGSGSSMSLNTGSGNIQLAGVDLSMTSGTLGLTSSGTVTLDSDVSAQNVTLTGVTGKLAIGGTLAITTGDTNLDLTKIAGGIDDTTAGAHGLTLDAGTANVLLASVNVGSVRALKSLNITAAQMSLGNVATAAGQSYTGNVQLGSTLSNSGSGNISMQGGSVTLGANSSVTDTSGNISVAGAINGGHSLTLSAASGGVTLTSAVGGSASLSSLSITGKTITMGAATTAGNQTYDGVLSLKGDLTSRVGALDFTGKLQVQAALTLTADTMGFNSSGMVSGTQTLTILPVTDGYTIDLGKGGTSSTELMIASDAFDGYQGKLYIGGSPGTATDAASGLAGLPTAANILVDGDMSLGSTGTLVITSKGDLTLESGIISADTVILGASGSLLSSPTGAVAPSVEGNNIYTIATQIGGNTATSQAINVAALPNSAAPQLFIGSKNTSVFFVEAPGTVENKDPSEVTLQDFADGLGITLSGNITVTNSGQQAAANQQTGGLLTSGFIDVSVFQQISLYDVSGSGIALPGDQCEEESSGPSAICGTGGQ